MKKTALLTASLAALVLSGCASTKKESETTPSQDLIFNRWQLVSAEGITTVPSDLSKVIMDLNSTQHGFVETDCNSLNFGLIDLTNNQFRIGTIASTRMACPNMTAQNFIAAHLPAMSQYSLSHDGAVYHLLLSNENGQKLKFRLTQ